MLKPQDILVALKLLALNGEARGHSYASLASSIGMSASETHAAVRRAVRCRLLSSFGSGGVRRGALPSVSIGNFLNFVENGLPFVLPAEKGSLALGIPTGVGAPPLRDALVVGAEELLPVWPWSGGSCKGISLKPVYPSCPVAAANDPGLYRLLSLVDAIRDDGGIRQRQTAVNLFKQEARSLDVAIRQPVAAL